MNRYKAEEARKRHDARAGKTESEIESINREDVLNTAISKLAQEIHIQRYPEEYDHYSDSIADASDRRNGVSPMSAEYIARIAEKRLKEGVAPLAANGMPTSDETWKIACIEAEARLRNETGS
jgi:hypothetical protein